MNYSKMLVSIYVLLCCSDSFASISNRQDRKKAFLKVAAGEEVITDRDIKLAKAHEKEQKQRHDLAERRRKAFRKNGNLTKKEKELANQHRILLKCNREYKAKIKYNREYKAKNFYSIMKSQEDYGKKNKLKNVIVEPALNAPKKHLSRIPSNDVFETPSITKKEDITSDVRLFRIWSRENTQAISYQQQDKDKKNKYDIALLNDSNNENYNEDYDIVLLNDSNNEDYRNEDYGNAQEIRDIVLLNNSNNEDFDGFSDDEDASDSIKKNDNDINLRYAVAKSLLQLKETP